MAKLILTVEETPKYQAVKTKYSASKFMRISRLSDLTGPFIKKLASQAEDL